jgi:DNA transformation protein
MPKPNPYLDFLSEQLELLGDINIRPMFGGYGIYCNGLFFALVGHNALYLKADDVNRPEFAARGLQAFRPRPDRDDSMSYYEAPAEMFEDPDALKHWCGGAIEAAHRAKQKPRAKRKRHS